jgi:hypothetical protein
LRATFFGGTFHCVWASFFGLILLFLFLTGKIIIQKLLHDLSFSDSWLVNNYGGRGCLHFWFLNFLLLNLNWSNFFLNRFDNWFYFNINKLLNSLPLILLIFSFNNLNVILIIAGFELLFDFFSDDGVSGKCSFSTNLLFRNRNRRPNN